ncbi:3'-5' exonuclease [uncultured Ruegeria sp.]|uniref:3'-5' exonuclease n=1 Tax=uncultured Ruegeria sp. TaxID=259304 RepID=UPI00260A3A92|nr:3'-5' exonuclease [uncultured Ruegeria sp.]
MVALPKFPDPKPLSPAILSAYSMARYVYFDIETIPNQRPDTLEKLKSQVTAPATFKKPESIEKWLDENRDRAAEEALAKTALDGGSGHVCTIGWAKNDGDIRVEHAQTVGEETEILTAFFSDLDPYHSETLTGHNIGRFDIPFLLKRAIVLGVGLPKPSSFPRDPKPWDSSIFDTMVAWAGARDFISMNALCGILGIVGKDDFDGSQVAKAWKNGEHLRIAEYCDSDVHRTRLMHQRFLVAGWPDGVTRPARKEDLPVIDDEIPNFEGAQS